MNSGATDAALLMALLGEAAGAAVLRWLGPQEIRALSAATAALDSAPRSRIEAVLARYGRDAAGCTGYAATARQALDATLVRALGAARANSVRLGLAGPTLHAVADLAWQPTEVIVARLAMLPAQAQAVVLAQWPVEVAAAVLECLPDQASADLIRHLAHAGAPSAEALAELDNWLGETGAAEPAGDVAAAELLTHLNEASARALLARLAEADPPLAHWLDAQTVRFEALPDLPLDVRRRFMQTVSARQLMRALKGAPPRLVEALLAVLSPAAAARLRDDLATQGMLPVAEVEAAQAQVLDVLRAVLRDAPDSATAVMEWTLPPESPTT